MHVPLERLNGQPLVASEASRWPRSLGFLFAVALSLVMWAIILGLILFA